jgi:outer membrane protein OmpA-like peptidoglycan-associated protein
MEASMKFTKVTLALAALLPMALSAGAVSKTKDHDVVRDRFGSCVKDSYGKCVIVRWERDSMVSSVSKKPATKTVKKEKKAAHVAKDKTVYSHSQTEMVHYGFDKAGISAESKQHLREIAVKMTPGKKVLVVGHADNTGPYEYNFKLSKQRALAAKNELVKYGINPSDIEVEAKSYSELLVETPKGVREGMNRRVEITFFTKK